MTISGHIWLWILFNVGVIILLCLDLLVFNKNHHSIKVKEALLWSALYVGIAGLFALGLAMFYHSGIQSSGPSAMSFVTGYLIEQSLSVDNLFVIMLIFTYFRTPTLYQHKVLFWGIIGAIFFRILFIFLGVEMINRFHFTVYILGALLIYTAIKMFFQKDTEIDPEKNIALRIFSKIMPVNKLYEGGSFFKKFNGIWHATPLFIVLLVIETTDIVFALDSIPAIIAITKDPFIVYSSNIFAVLGLRSLYFALAGIMKLFHFLHYGLSVILLYIGIEIIIQKVFPIPIWISLSVVAGILAVSIFLSLIFPEKTEMPVHHNKE